MPTGEVAIDPDKTRKIRTLEAKDDRGESEEENRRPHRSGNTETQRNPQPNVGKRQLESSLFEKFPATPRNTGGLSMEVCHAQYPPPVMIWIAMRTIHRAHSSR